MLVVVADTGPLRSLIEIAAIGCLPRLFQTVLVPEAVRRELSHLETPFSVRRWMGDVPAWLVVRPATVPCVVGTGLDEGFAVTGTLGLLDRAARRGLVDLADAFTRLRATHFRHPLDLMDALLSSQDAERTSR